MLNNASPLHMDYFSLDEKKKKKKKLIHTTKLRNYEMIFFQSIGDFLKIKSSLRIHQLFYQ